MLKFLVVLLSVTSLFATNVIEDHSNLQIKTPTLQQRKIKKLRLENGLEAYLVSDPGLTESAAMVAVNSGSLDDPQDALGLAHFLEHMLFMGTKKYPQEEDFSTFIQDHGGTYNAFTASDRTVYMFSIKNKYFVPAFDRLSHFFIDPLLRDNSLERERSAVDQEYGKNIEHDGWRSYLVLKELGNKDHPFSKFSIGTLDTLSTVNHEALQAFFDNHYSANLMKVVIYSPLPLDQLQSLIEDNLSSVENKNLVSSNPKGEMFDEKTKGKMIYLEPVKDLKTIDISWQLPAQFANDKTLHLDAILDYVFTSNEPGSLIHELKEDGLVDSMRVENDYISASNVLLTINMHLTEKGVREVNQVLLLLNQALAFYSQNTLPRSVFEDVKKTNVLDWEYQLRQDGFQKLYSDAHIIFNEDLSTFPQQSTIPTRYDAQSFKSFAQYLELDQAVILLKAPKDLMEKPLQHQEKWTGAKYSIFPIDWSDIKKTTNMAFSYPESNPFLPEQMPLIQAKDYQEPVAKLIEDSDFGKIYYAKDNSFFIPKAAVSLCLKTPKTTSSMAKLDAMNTLFVKVIIEKLNMTLNQAKNAGFEMQICNDSHGLNLYVKGWQGTIDRLMKELLQGIQNIELTEQEFESYKKITLSKLQNFSKEMPFAQGLAITKRAFLPGSHLPTEIAKSMQVISYQDFLQFKDVLFKQLYVEGVIFGALNKEMATEWKNEWISSFGSKPYAKASHRDVHVIVLPENKGPFELVHKVDLLGDATILSIQDGSDSLQEEVMQQLLTRVIHPLFFEQLRTKQQTGYIAKAIPLRIENQFLTTLLVQSKTHSANELLARFDLFLESVLKNFTELVDTKRFDSVKSSMIHDYAEPLQTIDDAMMRLTTLAFDYHGDFKRVEQKLKILDGLNYKQFQHFAQKLLSKGNKRRLAVLIEGGESQDRNDYKRLKNATMLQKMSRLTSFNDGKIMHID